MQGLTMKELLSYIFGNRSSTRQSSQTKYRNLLGSFACFEKERREGGSPRVLWQRRYHSTNLHLVRPFEFNFRVPPLWSMASLHYSLSLLGADSMVDRDGREQRRGYG